MRRCLDEGMLQSYLDGELSPELMEAAATHIAACASCAADEREAERELSMFTRAFASDAALAVPSERLRERIETAIAEARSHRIMPVERVAETETSGTVRRWFAALAASLTPSHAVAAFATLAAVVVLGSIFATVFMTPSDTTQTQVAASATAEAPPARSSNQQASEVALQGDVPGVEPLKDAATDPELSAPLIKEGPDGMRTVRAGYKPTVIARRNGRSEKASGAPATAAVAAKLLPGEEQYLKSIASLTKTIDAGGDAMMMPALRAQYERNLAVVDQAISATRRNAVRNPKDKDATDFLFSAYQNKVELLSAVADRTQVGVIGR